MTVISCFPDCLLKVLRMVRPSSKSLNLMTPFLRAMTGVVNGYEPLSEGTQILFTEGQKVREGEFIAKTPKTQAKTSDITTGLPRVAELFEARRPKEAAIIARISGFVEIGKQVKNKVTVKVRDPESDEVVEHLVPTGKRLNVNNEDYVEAGTCLTDGSPVLQEVLDICGPQKLQALLVESVQRVYLSQGVGINDKHIEIIVRQMMRKVRITDPHDTTFTVLSRLTSTISISRSLPAR